MEGCQEAETGWYMRRGPVEAGGVRMQSSGRKELLPESQNPVDGGRRLPRAAGEIIVPNSRVIRAGPGAGWSRRMLQLVLHVQSTPFLQLIAVEADNGGHLCTPVTGLELRVGVSTICSIA